MKNSPKVLITAGSTMTMIDEVRGVTNIFKGRTGRIITEYFVQKKQNIILLTSDKSVKANGFHPVYYKEYAELSAHMKDAVAVWQPDIIIHSAAVSDYMVEQTYAIKDGVLVPVSGSDKKISSEHKELYLKLVQTQKIVDLIRPVWGFTGQLVKFKLQVGISDEELIEIAQKSREHSDADIIVANCLEWSLERAYVIGRDNKPLSVSRNKLPEELYKRLIK